MPGIARMLMQNRHDNELHTCGCDRETALIVHRPVFMALHVKLD
jgi:hypothetical protein